mmetsp:Transcript_73755/g.123192  ORF Transcript_73755/g.123192 Transcript_73755/m.123192 type:complete len:204 (-) Transcript_73755:446-1057(-)
MHWLVALPEEAMNSAVGRFWAGWPVVGELVVSRLATMGELNWADSQEAMREETRGVLREAAREVTRGALREAAREMTRGSLRETAREAARGVGTEAKRRVLREAAREVVMEAARGTLTEVVRKATRMTTRLDIILGRAVTGATSNLADVVEVAWVVLAEKRVEECPIQNTARMLSCTAFLSMSCIGYLPRLCIPNNSTARYTQ